MSDDLRLPPHRALPDDVRHRLRTTVLAGIADPAPAPRRGNQALIAVAAAVVVVLAVTGLLIARAKPADVTPATTGPAVPVPTPMINSPQAPTMPSNAPQVMDRCWAELRQAGKAADVPDRSRWKATIGIGTLYNTVIGIRADHKVLFCETTLTTVSVSDPNQSSAVPAGKAVRTMFTSDDGVLAGVTNSPPFLAKNWFAFAAPAGTADSAMPFDEDGLFVALRSTPISVANARWTFASAAHPPVQGQDTEVADAPPLVFAVDRPHPGQQNQDLTHCLGLAAAGTHESMLDEASLQSGVTLTYQGTTTVVASNSEFGVTCRVTPGPTGQPTAYPAVTSWEMGQGKPFLALAESTANLWPGKYQIMGLVAPNVGTITITGRNGASTRAQISHGTMGAILDYDPSLGGGTARQFTATILDTGGKQIYQGPLDGM